jgi:transposase
LLAWILQHAPGPRVVVSMERTRSYGAGLARALTAAGVMVSSASSPAARPAVVSNAADAVVYERAMSG